MLFVSPGAGERFFDEFQTSLKHLLELLNPSWASKARNQKKHFLFFRPSCLTGV